MTVEIILLIIVIGILALSALIGFQKGFLRTIVGMSSLLISLALVVVLSPLVTDFITARTSFRQKVYESIDEKLTEFVEEKQAQTTEELKKAMEDSFIPSLVLQRFNEKISDRIAPQEYLHNASMFMATKVTSALGILVTLILSFVVLKLILVLTGLISKVPVVSGVNKVFGIVLGLVRGLILVWILCYFITVFSYTDIGQEAVQAMTRNKVLSLFYNGALSLGNII